MKASAFSVLAKVSVSLSPSGLPGADAIEKLLNGSA